MLIICTDHNDLIRARAILAQWSFKSALLYSGVTLCPGVCFVSLTAQGTAYLTVVFL